MSNQNPPNMIHSDHEVPWAVQLVLRVEKGADNDEVGAVKAVAAACVQMLAESENRPEWWRRVEEWHRGRIRKIVRRSRGARFERIADPEHGVNVNVGGWEVWAEVPGPVDEVRRDVAAAQVRGTHIDGEWPNEKPEGKNPQVAVNPHLDISTGKLAAQVSHAGGLIWWYATAGREDVRLRRDQWVADGGTVDLWRPTPTEWEALVAENADLCVDGNHVEAGAIIDAGFTEIPPGTNTVIWRWAP